MIELYLIRNAETTWDRQGQFQGSTDIGLSIRGKKQASLLTNYYHEQGIHEIISSKTTCAIHTARRSIDRTLLKLQKDARLNDLDRGHWHGKFTEEVQSRFEEEYNVYKSAFEKTIIQDGETAIMLVKRVESFMQTMQHEQSQLFERKIAVITHDIIIRILLVFAQVMEYSRMWETTIDNAGITKLSLNPNLHLDFINDTSHLHMWRSHLPEQAI